MTFWCSPVSQNITWRKGSLYLSTCAYYNRLKRYFFWHQWRTTCLPFVEQNTSSLTFWKDKTMRNPPGGDVRFSDAKNRLLLISWFYLMSLGFPFGGITKRRGCTVLIYAPYVTAWWVSQVRHGALCLWGENGSPGWTSLLSVFWIVSLHIPPLCQHVYPVSRSVLAVVLTCVSNGRDVSWQGQSSEGNGHYQNRGLLVAQQEEVWVGGWGSYSPILNPCSGLFGGRQ